MFNEVGKCAEKCLDAAAEFGEVIIITNSDDGWVKFSAERFVPNLLPCLERYEIISARTRYERFYPNQPLCWKAAAFAHEVNERFSSCDVSACEGSIQKGAVKSTPKADNDESFDVETLTLTDVDSSTSSEESETSLDVPMDETSPAKEKSSKNVSKLSSFFQRSSKSSPANRSARITQKNADSKISESICSGAKREVISFGDSMEERTAVKIISSQLEATPKSVMFISNPTPIQLIGQLTMLTSHMSFVCEHDKCLDLEISPHQAQKTAETFLKESGAGNRLRASFEKERNINRKLSATNSSGGIQESIDK
uniref:Uncharacterized protein n=1 Tax=Proboscia inermis TaxID=420281 RepID=A0A7S0GD80_9STRA|mmetsp:Transcript_22862/g.23220  ORF Transcript_22862/g.23220 Transcript_22862/m.23220 type:complete len:312 (+) Transcript_22862:252-1187(+)|eukprot:CAMPEP_0171294272 /NCGR_PEP_ID=MMETSP0816-20121228/2707_1 /TAXON_ID=420281 /ORGANISM="Proboscia inermis, Strain CCAP1064/1" /LENGTH=311 /DNA_ID=CAMNT_0011765927 /DNA_START=222 /DNA_END=1157 /DNA_ORIENTATION=-